MATKSIDITTLVTPERFESWLQASLGRSRLPWLDETMRQLAEAVDGVPELDRFRMAARKDAERAEVPFEVFVVGEGKHGKSTLINALYGAPVAAVDFLPKTWCFHRYVQNAARAGWVRLVVRNPLQPDQGHLEGRLGDRQPAVRGTLAEYECRQKQAEDLLNAEEARTWENAQYISPIVEVEWRITSAQPMVASLRLVDTHGLSQLLARPLQQAHFDWEFARADAVLWVLRAMNLTSKETRESMASLGRYRKRVILVLNRMDEVPEGQRERVLEAARQQFAGKVQDIVPFVGQWAWDGRNNPELLERSGYRRLEAVLQEQLLRKAAMLRQKQRCQAAREQLAGCRRGAEELDRILTENAARFTMASARTGGAATAELDAIVHWRRRAGAEVMARFEGRLGSISATDGREQIRTRLRLGDEERELQRQLTDLREQIRRRLREHADWLNQNATREVELTAQGGPRSQSSVYSNRVPAFPAELIKIEFDPKVSVDWLDRIAGWFSKLFGLRDGRSGELRDSLRKQFEGYLPSLLDGPCGRMRVAIEEYAGTVQRDIEHQLQSQQTVARLERVRLARTRLEVIAEPDPLLGALMRPQPSRQGQSQALGAGAGRTSV